MGQLPRPLQEGSPLASSAAPELKHLRQCPVCARPYTASEVQVVEQIFESQLIHLACSNCASAFLALIVTSGTGHVSSIGMVTDLTVEDVMRFKESEPISLDDVLAFHELLSHYDLRTICKKENEKTGSASI